MQLSKLRKWYFTSYEGYLLGIASVIMGYLFVVLKLFDLAEYQATNLIAIIVLCCLKSTYHRKEAEKYLKADKEQDKQDYIDPLQ